MQLALLILAGLGALLFAISFLAYVIAGFRHHFVTGLIAALPVLNIITLPSLWDKSRRNFIFAFIGLIIFMSTWLLGADKGIHNLLSRNHNLVSTDGLIGSVIPNNSQATLAPDSRNSRPLSLDQGDILDLPNKALYKMGFDIVPVSQINTLQGRIVQITTTDNTKIEGRIKNISLSSVVLEGLFENEFPITSIKQLKLMVKKAN